MQCLSRKGNVCFISTFFCSPTLVEKLFYSRIYCLGTVGSDQGNMAIMEKDKDFERGDINFQYVNNVVALKWFDNHGMTMVCTCLEECTKVSTITRRVTKQSTKITVPWPEIMKGYKPRMGCVDPLDQKIAAYKLDRKSSDGCYYLTLFFDLMDISVVNLHNVYKV